MEEKKIDPISPGMTSNSSHIASVYGNDFLELVWQNGQILVQGGSSPTSSRTEKRPSCFGYSLNPCREGYDEDPSITKKARLNTLYSLFDSSHQNSQQTRDQPSYLFDCKYIKSNSFSNKLGDEFSNSRAGSKETNSKPTTVGNTQLCSSSSQSQKHDDSGSDQGIGKLNFSNFLRPALFLKSAYQGSTATQPRNGAVSARVEEFKAATDAAANANSKAPDHSVVIDSSNKGSHSPNGLQHHEDQTALTSHKANRTPFVAKTDQETVLPDQHSEAIKTQESHGQYHNQTHKAKRKSAAELYNEPMVASSSLCSLGASNDPTLRSRKHEDTDDSTYISDNDEEPEDVIKDTPAREGLRGKRSRNAAIHNLSERKRRDKINKKMRALKELIPNCNKMDKASMLDDAIDYLRTLKLQLQVMSMGSGLCMPLMMLPGGGGGHHIPQLMGGGMSLRPSGIGIPYSLPPQYPNIPHLSLHAHGHGVTDNTLHMLGFPNHMLPMPFSMSPPFIPMPSNVCATQASNQGTN